MYRIMRGDAMRYQRMLGSVLGVLLAPAFVHAQTEQIQREIETKLWIWRIFGRIEAATGAPPLVSSIVLLAIGLALVTAVWLVLRRNRTGGSTPGSPS